MNEIWKDLWQLVCDIPQRLILAPKVLNGVINDMKYEMKSTLRKFTVSTELWVTVNILDGKAAGVI